MNIRNFIDIRSLLLENKTVKQTIFKNTFWLGLTGIVQKGVSFLVIVWIARHFGPVIYGQWAFALSFTALFAFLPNFGFGLLAIRELARDKVKTAKYLDNIIVMKFVLGLIALGLIAVIIQFFGKDPEIVKLVYFLGIYTVLNTFADFFQSIFRANQKMQYEALCQGIRSLGLLGLVGLFMLNKDSILSISYAYIGAVLVGILFSLLFIWRYFSQFFLEIDFKICNEILKKAWPFAIGVIFTTIYCRSNIILLSVITKNDKDVGIFSIAYGFAFLTFLIPQYITISIFPYFSKLFIENKQSIVESFKKLFKIFFSLGLFISFFTFLLAPSIIKIIYGEQYYNSIIILRFLSIAIFFGFIKQVASMSLCSVNLQKKVVKIQCIATLVNVGTNIMFIPIIGVYGAVIAVILTEIVLSFGYYYFFYQGFYKKWFKVV